MRTILYLIGTFICDLLFKSRQQLEAENLFLRHQLNVALRCAAHRFQLRRSNRAVLVWMTRRMPSLLDLTWIVRLETSCAGIEQDFAPIGAGSRAAELADLQLTGNCATSFVPYGRGRRIELIHRRPSPASRPPLGRVTAC